MSNDLEKEKNNSGTQSKKRIEKDAAVKIV